MIGAELCWLFLVALLVGFNNAKPAVLNKPTALDQYKQLEFRASSTIIELHIVLFIVLVLLL